MKKEISKFIRGCLLCVATVLFAASCTTDEITYKTGQKPDKETLENVYGTLRSSKSLRDRVPVNLDEGDHAMSDRIYWRLSQSSSQPVSVTVVPDLSLVEEYNAANKTNLKPLPVANVDIANNGQLSVAAGERISEKLDVTIKANGLEPGIYLMPVTVTQTVDDIEKKQVIYYGVKIREFDENRYQQNTDEFYDIDLDPDWMTVFYLNTSEAQPLYADFAVLEAADPISFERLSIAALGHIINLRIVQVGYDPVGKRAILAPTSDIRYVLENRNERIKPMQDKGRKICICIEGGGAGIGFCNMSDAQITDFVGQVKDFVTIYELDGINLWDRGSGYGKEGMPAVNTTSYPKLIKALREAMPDKMLTVVDYEEPTESFHDITLTGGIAVGDYIDYAWHGYVSKNEPVAFADPYNPYSSFTQAHERKQIAKLPKEKYGNVFIPFYDEMSDLFMDMNMDMWTMNMIMWGLERQNNILVFDDLALPAAVAYEGGYINGIMNVFMYLQYDADFNQSIGYSVLQRISFILRKDGYETWNKNW